MGEIGGAIGSSKLGYNLTIVPPGKRAFPMHCHHVIEEMFLVLEGSGEIRHGGTVQAIRKGDCICCPAGGPDTAHQIINTQTQGDLKYLAVSTMEFPDICEYPDSGKTLVSHRPRDEKAGGLRLILSSEQGAVDYWDGEN